MKKTIRILFNGVICDFLRMKRTLILSIISIIFLNKLSSVKFKRDLEKKN